MSIIQHIQISIKLLEILYFTSLWIILVFKAFSIVPQKAFNARVDLSESDFKQGRFKSSTELSNKYK
jgi:hypothetical protein